MTENEDKSKGALFWFIIGFSSFFALCTFVFVLIVGGLFTIAKTVVPKDVVSNKVDLTETEISGNGENKIVLIPISGIISDTSAESILWQKPGIVSVVQDSLKQAAKDNGVKAVILVIDSPGGGITASDKIYNSVIRFKEKTNKSVVVCMQDMAASGGYYIAVAADKIVAHPTTITGSIGVIMPIVNFSELIGKYGIKDASIKSGKMKDIGSPLKSMLPAEEKVLNDIIMEMYTRFVTLISIGRNMPVEQVKLIADGRIYTGTQALQNGLVDQVGYIDDAINVAKELAGIEEAKVIEYHKKFNVGTLFSAMAAKVMSKQEITFKLDNFPVKGMAKPMYILPGVDN